MIYVLASAGEADVPTIYQLENGKVVRCWPHTPDAPGYAEVQGLIDGGSAELCVMDHAEAQSLVWSSPDLALQKKAKADAVNATRRQLLAAGAPWAGKRIAVHDSARADLNAMATTALAAIAGSLPWPESFAAGWICLDNSRLPLPTPRDGLALADAVSRYQSSIIQASRTMKDAVFAASDVCDLGAVDISTNWPTSA